jgi:predicted ATPase
VDATGETRLTTREVSILERLARADGAVVEARELRGAPAGQDLRSLIHRLRAKIEPDPAAPVYLLTQRGGGYRLVVPEPPSIRDDLDAFVGRAEASAELAAAVAVHRWTVVIGAGGVGKTRLVRAVLAGRSSVWWVDLGSATTAGDVEAEVARALDLGGQVSGAQLGRVLARKGPGWLVLDNLEQLVDAIGPSLRQWLADAPDLRIVGTSRLRLDVEGERVVELGPLPTAEAAELYVVRARAAFRSAPVHPHDPDVVSLVDRLDGLPLAIELAAAARLPVRDLLERLDRRLELLERARPTTERHRSLHSAFDWSWQRLGPDERAALTRLALFGAGFGLLDVEGLLGADGFLVLQGLRDQSLVYARPHGATFGMLETVRLFAGHERGAEADGGRATELAWARWVAGREGAEAVDLESAARLALRWDERELAASCAAAAGMIRYERGPFAPAIALVQDTLAKAHAAGDACARLWLALAKLQLADAPRSAVDSANRAIAEATLPALRGEGWSTLASAYHTLRTERDFVALTHRGGEASFRASEAFAEAGRDDLARWHRARGLIATTTLSVEIDETLEAALPPARAHGDDRLEGQVLSLLGKIYDSRGAPELARARLTEAVALHRSAGRKADEVADIASLMLVLQNVGDHDALEEVADRALALAEAIGSLQDDARILAYLASSRILRADPRWRQTVARARSALRQRPNARYEAYLELREAEAYLAAGDATSAVALARRSLGRSRGLDDAHNVRRASGILARALAVGGDLDEAWALAEAAVDPAHLGNTLATARAQHGEVALARGDRDTARADLAQAEALARKNGVAAPLSEAGIEIARLRAALGDPPTAP